MILLNTLIFFSCICKGELKMNNAYLNYKILDTYMIIIFHANGEEHVRSKNKDYLLDLQDKLKKRGIESYVVKTAGKVN